ncbi:MAG: 3,4-dihydroxy-2-butanone-4-phosphate synthase [Myxococcales bacterium]|nr:3,4-dihydroxy-2-butanone-4-phosphate synthase [Myxococcales bacterium]
MAFSSIEDALTAIAEGRMVILVDDEDRENEGDLVMAAELVTPAAINFMAKEARGLICLTMTDERLRKLNIPMMVSDNTSPLGTAFTVSIEARTGVTTGISAADRARTIQVAVDDNSTAADLTRPGHIFPLRAMEGGVLVRTGQTEGSVDLCRLAGLKPAGVICEIMSDDGEMARLPELSKFAEQHNLPLVSIADLIQYRLQQDSLVRELTSAPMKSDFGPFELKVFSNSADNLQHYAIIAGEPSPDRPTLVRVQHQCLTSDVFHSTSCTCGSVLRYALQRIAEEGEGVLLYLQDPEHSRLENVLTHMLKQQRGAAAKRLGEEEADPEEVVNRPNPALRKFGIGAQILRKLGVGKMRLISSSPKKIAGLAGYDLEIVEQIVPSNQSEPSDAEGNIVFSDAILKS